MPSHVFISWPFTRPAVLACFCGSDMLAHVQFVLSYNPSAFSAISVCAVFCTKHLQSCPSALSPFPSLSVPGLASKELGITCGFANMLCAVPWVVHSKARQQQQGRPL